jgi:hypothetical protein
LIVTVSLLVALNLLLFLRFMLSSLHNLSLNLKDLLNPRDLNLNLNLKFPILFNDRELLLICMIFNKRFFELWVQIESARIIHNTNIYIILKIIMLIFCEALLHNNNSSLA